MARHFEHLNETNLQSLTIRMSKLANVSAEAFRGIYTLFSEYSAHENQPNFLKSLGHRPPTPGHFNFVNSFESNSKKTPCQNCKEFSDGVFCIKVLSVYPWFGSVTQGHRENWTKSICTSFGEECKSHIQYSCTCFMFCRNIKVQLTSEKYFQGIHGPIIFGG